MSRDPKQQRPSPSDGGDFARGERTLPAAPAGPDFARGERELPQPDVVPDYARGERELPPDGDGPDFARGQREESDTGAPLLAPTKEESDQVDTTNQQHESRQRRRKERKMSIEATWAPHTKHGRLTTQSDLPDSVFAFPRERKEPLTDAMHVRNALARFLQVEGVSDAERDLAFANIKAAADYYGVTVRENDWRELE